MLNEAYRMKFAPATARGDAVAVSMVWLVANTTVKGRHDVDMQALRQALRLQHDAGADRAAADSRRKRPATRSRSRAADEADCARSGGAGRRGRWR